MSRRVDELIGGKTRNRKGQDVEKCPTCGEDCPPNTVHCEGSKLAYGCLTIQAHHGKAFWPACWKCNGSLGCTLCVPGGYQDRESKLWRNPDLICKRCRVKATLDALLNGGPISEYFLIYGARVEFGRDLQRHTPDLGEYPQVWARVYAKQRARQLVAEGLPADESDTEGFERCREAFKRFALASIPKPKGHYALLREKNRQAKEAAEKAEQFQATDADLPEGCWDEAGKEAV